MSQCSVEGKAWWIIQMRIRVHTVKLTVSSPQKEFVLHSVVNKKKKWQKYLWVKKRKRAQERSTNPAYFLTSAHLTNLCEMGVIVGSRKLQKFSDAAPPDCHVRKVWGEGVSDAVRQCFFFCSRTDARLCYSGNEQMIKDAIVFHLFYELWGHEKKQNIYYAITKKHCWFNGDVNWK